MNYVKNLSEDQKHDISLRLVMFILVMIFLLSIIYYFRRKKKQRKEISNIMKVCAIQNKDKVF